MRRQKLVLTSVIVGALSTGAFPCYASASNYWAPGTALVGAGAQPPRFATPPSAFDAQPNPDAVIQFRALHWTSWKQQTAVGRGRARYCADRCSRWHAVRFKLMKVEMAHCGLASDPPVPYYGRYRLTGVPQVARTNQKSNFWC